MPLLTFDCISGGVDERRTIEATNLVLAAWTGRDKAALQHHIDELAALGVPPPTSVPTFYRTSVDHIVQSERLQVLGPHTSGEVEYVLLPFDDGLWFTVGSDQTDRAAETMGVALSKQLAAKVFARQAWRLADWADRWDTLTIRAWETTNGARALYQDATLGQIRPPAELIEGWAGARDLPAGTVMMSRTPPAIGGIRPADRFDMEIADPASGAAIRHGYDIEVLPVIV